jgi:HSP20 family protein
MFQSSSSSQNSLKAFLPGIGVVRRELEKAFDDLQSRPTAKCSGTCAVTVWQDEQHVHVELDVPGFAIGDLNLNYEDGNLAVRGERVWPEDRNQPDFNERRFGKFERVIALSDIVDPATIDAALCDGVLKVSFNKKVDAVAREVQIRYQGGVDGGSDG